LRAAELAVAAIGLLGQALAADKEVRVGVIYDFTKPFAAGGSEAAATGAFGRFFFIEEVEPTAENRKTGKLVAMAVIKTLRQLASALVIGG
jgi:predicted dinucleotide-utilizing enzyme